MKNQDNLCLARSILLAKAKVESDKGLIPKRTYQKLKRDNRRDHLGEAARELCKTLNISMNRPGVMTDLPVYENALNVQIVVFGKSASGIPIRHGQNREKKIYLWYIDRGEGRIGHFHPITTVTGFLASAYFCDKCYKGRDRPYHKCKDSCTYCHSTTCLKKK
ncbi:MAG: hypothetical protein GY701_24285, partial [Sulfitobacter sp.]|nr:hypothetical protein [Sulfitobacter sp.]